LLRRLEGYNSQARCKFCHVVIEVAEAYIRKKSEDAEYVGWITRTGLLPCSNVVKRFLYYILRDVSIGCDDYNDKRDGQRASIIL